MTVETKSNIILSANDNYALIEISRKIEEIEDILCEMDLSLQETKEIGDCCDAMDKAIHKYNIDYENY